jgi:hypothetical protein
MLKMVVTKAKGAKLTGKSNSGKGCSSTSLRIPLSFSVKHTNLKGIDKLRFTIAYKRLTYSDGNLSPHFIKTLFLDLDVVIVDNMDDFFTVKGDFLIAHDKKNPTKIEGNSSVFRIAVLMNDITNSQFKKKTLHCSVSYNQHNLILSNV